MRYRLFLSMVLCFSLSGKIQAQSGSATDENILKVKNLLSNYNNSYFIEPEKALSDAREAYALSRKIKYPSGQAEALQCIGMYFQDRQINVKGSLDSADYYFSQSLSIFRQQKENEKILSALLSLARNSSIKRDLKKAEHYFTEALQLAERTKAKEAIEECFIGLENIYERLGDREKALDYTIKLRSLKKPEGEEEEARLLYQLGDLCMDRGSCEKALPFYYEAHRLFQKRVNHHLLEGIRNKIDIALKQCRKAKEETDTLSQAFQSFEIYKSLKDTLRMIRIAHEISLCFLKSKNDPEKAIDYLQQALRLAKQSKNTEAEALAYITLARIYAEQNRTAEAQQHFQYSKRLYEVLVNEQTVKQIAEMEARYESEQKKQAIRAVERDKELLRGENKIQHLQLKEAIYEQEKKQQILMSVTKDKELLSKKNQVQELEISQQRYFILGMALLFALATVVVVLIIRQSRLKSRYKQLEAEQKALRTQMNPHFIFNALISIQNFIHQNDPKEAVNYLGKFSALMRLVLEHSRDELVDLESEIKLLDYYLSLERLRAEGKLEYSIHCSDEIEPETIYLPTMLLQPFVENAIVHGFKGIEYKGKIEIHFEATEEELICTISDNGIGRTKASEHKALHKTHTSLSMKIVEERTKVYARKSGKKIKIDITDSEHGTGTKVIIHIPF